MSNPAAPTIASIPSVKDKPIAGRLLVRILYPTDVGAYRALRLAAIEEAPADFATTHAAESAIAPNRMQQRLVHTPFQRVFGAFDGTALVGMASVKREPIARVHDRAHIWGLYVAPQARGRGYGRALLNAALDYAGAVPELARVTLMVGVHNEVAKALYRSLGFSGVGTGAAGDEHDEEQMVLLLRP